MIEHNSISVILPVVDETISLKKTIQILDDEIQEFVLEYFVIIGDITTEASLKIIENLKQKHDNLRVYHQKKPFLGNALREAIPLIQGKYTIMMSSDLETDPRLAKKMIDIMNKEECDIVVTSRWIKGGGFIGYNKIKYLMNWLFQKLISSIYSVGLTDLSYAYRLYDTKYLKMFKWEEEKHPFLLESIVKPLRVTNKIEEIPAIWKSRMEGESQNNFLTNFLYIKTALKFRFKRKDSFIRDL